MQKQVIAFIVSLVSETIRFVLLVLILGLSLKIYSTVTEREVKPIPDSAPTDVVVVPEIPRIKFPECEVITDETQNGPGFIDNSDD